jgi:DNA (cytosine-5)-methyltransferase 1
MSRFYLDLFSGIGDFALGAEWAGMNFDKHYFSEVDDFAVGVYRRHFPCATALGDCRAINYASLPAGDWFVSGGFPCQPHSLAGSRRGGEDERDLWIECERMLGELRPRFALFENVPAILSSNRGQFFNRILSGISACGYDAEWRIISAGDIGAPHLRERLWFIAYPKSERLQSANAFPSDIKKRSTKKTASWEQIRSIFARDYQIHNWENYEGLLCRDDDGIPTRLDKQRIKALGNAVVPQITESLWRLVAEAQGEKR